MNYQKWILLVMNLQINKSVKKVGEPMMKGNEAVDAGWNFDNSYAHLPKSFFTIIDPNPVSTPELIIFNDSLATSLGLNVEAIAKRGWHCGICW